MIAALAGATRRSRNGGATPDEQYRIGQRRSRLDPRSSQFIVTSGRPAFRLSADAMIRRHGRKTDLGAQPVGHARHRSIRSAEPDMIGRGHGSAFIRRLRRTSARGGRAARRHRPRSRQQHAPSAPMKKPASRSEIRLGRHARWRDAAAHDLRVEGHERTYPASDSRALTHLRICAADRRRRVSPFRRRRCSPWATRRSAPAAPSNCGGAWCRVRRTRSTSSTGTRSRTSSTAFIFYGLTWLVLPRAPIVLRFAIAVGIEASWEILENTPVRHRTLPRRHDLAAILRRQRDQFAVRHILHGRGLCAGAPASYIGGDRRWPSPWN